MFDPLGSTSIRFSATRLLLIATFLVINIPMNSQSDSQIQAVCMSSRFLRVSADAVNDSEYLNSSLIDPVASVACV